MPKSKPPLQPKSQPNSQPKSQPATPTPPATTTPASKPPAKPAARDATAVNSTTPANSPVVSAQTAATPICPAEAAATFVTAAATPVPAAATPIPAAARAALAAAATLIPTATGIDFPPDAATLADPAQQQIARAKYQALHDQISSTRENLPGDDTANRTLLRDRAEEAQDVLTTLDRNDLQANTPAFTAAATQIQQANADMEKLSDSIGGIIHNIQATADFVQIANEAISAATKFIA